MSATALPQLQPAIVARLRATAALMALVTGVYDGVPKSARYPYAVFDDAAESPDRSFGQGGHAATFTITIWGQDGSATAAGTGTKGWGPLGAIADLVVGALTDIENNPLVVGGHDVVDVDLLSQTSERIGDGITRVIMQTYTVLLEDSLA